MCFYIAVNEYPPDFWEIAYASNANDVARMQSSFFPL